MPPPKADPAPPAELLACPNCGAEQFAAFATSAVIVVGDANPRSADGWALTCPVCFRQWEVYQLVPSSVHQQQPRSVSDGDT